MPYMPHLRCSTGLNPSREDPYVLSYTPCLPYTPRQLWVFDFAITEHPDPSKVPSPNLPSQRPIT
jgi:hypothetical protein